MDRRSVTPMLAAEPLPEGAAPVVGHLAVAVAGGPAAARAGPSAFCSYKFLPKELTLKAAATAVAENPANRPIGVVFPTAAMDLSADHLAVLTSRYWGSRGVKLTVGFMEQTPADLQQRILFHANAWGDYANIVFTLSQTVPQVRITRSGDGYWSYLGTDILHIPRNEPTMCLQGFTMGTSEAEYRRVVRHEVGHTLGFPHEHMRRSIIERLDRQKTIAYFFKTQGWSEAMVQQQVLTPLAESSIMGTPDADETSIMTYSLPGFITKDGRPVVGGSDIATQDMEFVGKLYPKFAPPPPPPPPPPPIGGGLDLSMDFGRKIVALALPAGWSVVKKAAAMGYEMYDDEQAGYRKARPSTPGESDMHEQARSVTPAMLALATELENCLAPGNDINAGRQNSPGGIISKVLALIAALRAQDWMATAAAVRDILNIILGEGGGITFQQEAAAAGLNWGGLIAVLLKLLPLILGA